MSGFKKVIIIGAGGRDFHNFNVFFRHNPNYRVVAFTATQIPNIDNRRYPKELAGEDLYPDGIPIYNQKDLPDLIKKYDVDLCVFSYSDVSHNEVMNIGSIVLSCGASYMLLGPKDTMLKSKKPVIAIGAVRTGCGKSQTTRRVIEVLMEHKLKVAVVRHPMPYGDLNEQRIQRLETLEDLKIYNCTIEEMEEFEPHIRRGNVVYAGVDYEAILRDIENDSQNFDIIVWDGGNNDFPFYKPDIMITVTDPLRAGHEVLYHPGETTLRMANVVIINKIDSASLENINILRQNIRNLNPNAIIIEAASPIVVDKPELIRGKKALIIEDGPTLTHGEMKFGAGVIAAYKYGASEIVNPRPYAIGSIAETLETYKDVNLVLPAIGYGEQQIKDLENTINNTPHDIVIVATPIDLSRIIKLTKPHVYVRYELQEIGKPDLKQVISEFIKKKAIINSFA
ncbi:MAG: cyclic 2,3-diphosphoglycerate synthase [Bacteroidales bacterium]|nr:cyclic 2,3-diphosphoglycerate synthase [Bacteroidales bacterium]